MTSDSGGPRAVQIVFRVRFVRVSFRDDCFAVSIIHELTLVLVEGTRAQLGLSRLGRLQHFAKELLVGGFPLARVSHLAHDLQVLAHSSAMLPGTAALEGGALASDALHLLGERGVRTCTSLESGALGLQLTVAHRKRSLCKEKSKHKKITTWKLPKTTTEWRPWAQYHSFNLSFTEP